MASSFRVAVFLLVSTAAWGQSTLRVEVPVVTVDASVTTADGRPVHGLRQEDFRVLDGGEEQPLRYFGATEAPWHVYLLLDISQSTEDQREFMTDVVSGFLRSTRTQDQIAIGVFGDDVETLVAWNDTRETALADLGNWGERGPSGAGTTELYEALGQVLREEFRRVDERRAVIALTDGRDVSLYRQFQQQGGAAAPEEDPAFSEIRKTAARANIPLYFVAMNTDRNLVPKATGNEYQSLLRLYPGSGIAERYLEQVRLRLEELSQITGGEVFLPADAGEVVPSLTGITRALSNVYTLGWAAPVTGTGLPTRPIEIRLDDPDYHVHLSRTEYAP